MPGVSGDTATVVMAEKFSRHIRVGEDKAGGHGERVEDMRVRSWEIRELLKEEIVPVRTILYLIGERRGVFYRSVLLASYFFKQ